MSANATASNAPAAGEAAPRVRYVLRLADASLVLGQRLGEWIGHAPALEEDLGVANIALDLMGQARLLLEYAGELEGRGRDEDALVMLRRAVTLDAGQLEARYALSRALLRLGRTEEAQQELRAFEAAQAKAMDEQRRQFLENQQKIDNVLENK